MAKAIFLDRDGVINEMVYDREYGLVDSPATPEQYRLLADAAGAIERLREAGYKTVLVSNQPGMAKRKMTRELFDHTRDKMRAELARAGAALDGEYYCFHHPEALEPGLRIACECRKPKPGLLLEAARDLDIDLSQSWMIGDGLTDVQAGRAAGCRTVLIARMKCEFCRFMDKHNARPDVVKADLMEAAEFIIRGGGCNGNFH